MKVFPILPRPADTVTCPVCRNYNVEATHCDNCDGKGYVQKVKPNTAPTSAADAERAAALFDNGWELLHMHCGVAPYHMYAVSSGRDMAQYPTPWFKSARDAVDSAIQQKAKRDAAANSNQSNQSNQSKT